MGKPSEEKSLKEKLKYINEWIGDWLKISSSLGGLFAGFGFLIIIFYCLEEGIVPNGFSVGDWIFVAIIFTLLCAIILLSSVVAVFPFIWIISLKCRKIRLKKFLRTPLVVVYSTLCSIIILIPIFYLWHKDKFNLKFLYPFLLFMCCGAMLIFVFGCGFIEPYSKLNSKSNIKKNISPVAIILIIIAFVWGVFVNPSIVLNPTMVRSGIRSGRNDIIVMNQEERDFIINMVKFVNNDDITSKFYEMPQSKLWCTTYGQIVWGGIGITSYIRIPNNDNIFINNNMPE
ncbi:MAG: hypothetical protein LBH31_06705, partial [Burkholderiaceae bacterium]|nr:hypothetical protein [Burkholderiaceae bacterium]